VEEERRRDRRSWRSPEGAGRFSRHPVEHVSWNMCRGVMRQLGLVLPPRHSRSTHAVQAQRPSGVPATGGKA
jgi:hypothetical protein